MHMIEDTFSIQIKLFFEPTWF